jgi:hypothetical protein
MLFKVADNSPIPLHFARLSHSILQSDQKAHAPAADWSDPVVINADHTLRFFRPKKRTPPNISEGAPKQIIN